MLSRVNISDGRPIVIKPKIVDFYSQSDAEMMTYTHSQNLLIPAVFDIQARILRVCVTLIFSRDEVTVRGVAG